MLNLSTVNVADLKPENKYISTLINFFKLLLLFSTFGFIFYKIFYAYHLEDLLMQSQQIDMGLSQTLLFVTAFVLMGFNWMLEASKWQLLINKNEKFTYFESLKAVLSGVTLSIITPNQIGDFAGRIIHLKKYNKLKGAIVTVIGHTAQMFMTAAFGLYAMIWFFEDQGRITATMATALYITLFVFIVAGVVAYLNLHLLTRLKMKEKFKEYFAVFGIYKRKELLQVMIFAFLRYSVFICQYYLFLNLYGVDIGNDKAFACIIATLCAQSFVPSFILIELGMRGVSALWFFGLYTENVVGVLLSAYTLWIVNLMIPGLLGLAVILRWRFTK